MPAAVAGGGDQQPLDAILSTVPGPFKSKNRHYEAILQANDARAPGQHWPDASMQKAAGIDPANAKKIRDRRAPDTPRTAEVRTFLAGSAPAGGQDSGLARYRRALNQNDTRAPEQHWPDASMQKAAGIAPAHAKTIRDRRMGAPGDAEGSAGA